MAGRMFVIPPSGEIVVTELETVPPIEELQKAVGGYIETVPYFTKYKDKQCVAFCNEEGKLKGLPYNSRATNDWGRNTPLSDDVLVGPVVILTGDRSFMEVI
jgi:hypothetical protein